MAWKIVMPANPASKLFASIMISRLRFFLAIIIQPSTAREKSVGGGEDEGRNQEGGKITRGTASLRLLSLGRAIIPVSFARLEASLPEDRRATSNVPMSVSSQ